MTDKTNPNYCRYTTISNEIGPRTVPDIPVKTHEKYSVYGINGGFVGTIEYSSSFLDYSFNPDRATGCYLSEKTLRFIADKLEYLNSRRS